MADIRQTILDSPMSRVQVIAIAIILGINALDGYDVLCITYALPGIGAEWGLQRTTLGVAISAGLVGMALGAFLLTALADILGRRPVTLMFLALMAAGMLSSAVAPNVGTLIVCRFATGLGIGGMIPVLNVTAGEHANAKRRNLAIAIAAAGFPLGGLVGGSIAALLLQHYDWRSLFIFGGLASAVAFVLVIVGVPESIEFLIARRQPDSLQRVNAILVRMGQRAIDSLPAPKAAPKVPLARIFQIDLLRPTVAITAAYLLLVMTFYFVMSWIPQITRDLGGSPSQGASMSALASGFGIVGSIALGQLAPRLGLGRLTLMTIVGSAVMTVMIGLVPADLTLFAVFAAISGLVLFAAFTGVYALVVQCFPVEVRATAAGFVVGFGRIGAAMSPLVSGMMFGMGFSRSTVAALMGVSAFLAALALASVTMQARRAARVVGV